MNFPKTPQTAATPSAPTISQTTAQASSEPSTRSPSPIESFTVSSRNSSQADRGNAFWANTEPLCIEYPPSVTHYSSPCTRQGSVVDLEALKKKPYITVNAKARRDSEEPYHVFSHGKKWSIVVLIGAAGLFSGLSSNIYFPALDAIAKVSLANNKSSITGG